MLYARNYTFYTGYHHLSWDRSPCAGNLLFCLQTVQDLLWRLDCLRIWMAGRWHWGGRAILDSLFNCSYSENIFGQPILLSLVAEETEAQYRLVFCPRISAAFSEFTSTLSGPEHSLATGIQAGWFPECDHSRISASLTGRLWSQYPGAKTKSSLTNIPDSNHPHCNSQSSDAHH